MKINLGGITYHCDTAGPWMSTEIFLKGCNRNCPGCFNPQLKSFDDPTVFEVDDLVRLLTKNVPYKRVTISGGEPLLQPIALGELVHKLKLREFVIICYTGYTWHEIRQMFHGPIDDTWLGLEKVLENIDFLVDGPFEVTRLNPGTGYEPGKWVGSNNQRVIDVPRTFREGRLVLWPTQQMTGTR